MSNTLCYPVTFFIQIRNSDDVDNLIKKIISIYNPVTMEDDLEAEIFNLVNICNLNRFEVLNMSFFERRIWLKLGNDRIEKENNIVTEPTNDNPNYDVLSFG